MRLTRVLPMCAVVVAAFLLGQGFAEDGKGGGGGAPPQPEWTKLTDHHRSMAKSAGDWTVAGQVWMGPGGPTPFAATASREAILNGYVVHETFKANWQGQPFEGHLFQGYDTVRKRFVTIWMDNKSPNISIGYGQMKDGVLVSHGEEPDYMTGKLKKTKSTIQFGKGNVTMTMYDVLDAGERKTMQLVYTRK